MSKKSKEFSEDHDSPSNGTGTENELYNFPSIGRLFSNDEPERLKKLRGGYERAKSDLDVIIRKGTNEEADSAARAQRAIMVTLDFLKSLESEKTS